jgi:hypothetical protein
MFDPNLNCVVVKLVEKSFVQCRLVCLGEGQLSPCQSSVSLCPPVHSPTASMLGIFPWTRRRDSIVIQESRDIQSRRN